MSYTIDLASYRVDNVAFLVDARTKQGEGFSYLAGPYTGRSQCHQRVNVLVMRAYHWMLTANNLLPVAMPLMTSQYDKLPMTENFPHDVWINQCEILIHRATLVLLMPNWQESKGTKMEKSFAESNGIPVLEIPPINIITLEQIMRMLEVMQ